LLSSLAGGPGGVSAKFSLSEIGVRNCARRRKRSVATLGLLACGSFLIASIGVFRLDAVKDSDRRQSGTGGFALIGESTLPIVQDLNSKPGRDFFGLDDQVLTGVTFVPFRVREGDDASCLNLNRAQRPRLFGVKPAGGPSRVHVQNGGERIIGGKSLVIVENLTRQGECPRRSGLRGRWHHASSGASRSRPEFYSCHW